MKTKQRYSFLEPIKVGPTELKNRIIYPAMGKSLASEDGFITDRYIEYFRTIARGGVSLITTGIMVIDPEWHYISVRQPWLSDDKFIPGLKRLTQAIHAENCKIMFQPWQSGQAGQPTGSDAPKPVTVNDFSQEQIHKIQDQWVAAARRAKLAGADGIEFHLAHTYLPSQFLSPYFNHRTDEYGSQTVENSMRFSLEIIERIQRELADEQFFITAKINGDDFVEGGTTIQRTKEACQMLEKAGVAMITVNGGGALTKVTGMSDNGVQKEGWKVPFAEAVKEVVKIPVAASGSLRHPDFVNDIIAQGKCDLAAIGRGILAEPEWVKKCVEGREDEMRYCISCMFCFSRTPEGVAGCSVNPFAKRELEKPELVKDGDGRKVVVIGAGPAGLEAAVTLAQRGFRPVVFEKEKEIGGLVALAARPPHKEKINWLLDYYRRQIEKLGIQVILDKEATVEDVQNEKPYAVVLASGSKEFMPPIPGLQGSSVVTARDMFRRLERETISGKSVIVLGAGLTGIELAHLIQSKGNEVSVLELMSPPEAPTMEQKLALEAAKVSGVVVNYEQKLEAVEGNTLHIMDIPRGTSYEITADLIVCAMGIRPENRLAPQLEDLFKPQFYTIGDCEKTGKISTSVSAGSDLGYGLK